MHPVGDGVNFEPGKERFGNLAMLFGHPIDVTAQIQGQQGQIELLATCQTLQQRQGNRLAQDALDHLVGKPVVAGLHRGMGGKYTTVHDPLEIPGTEFILAVILPPTGPNQQIEGEQGGVAFVQMKFAQGETQGLENADASQSQNDLLLEPILQIAAVKMIGDMPILPNVAGDVGIEKQHRNHPAGGTLDPVEPGLDLDVAILDGDQGFGRQQFHLLLRMPVDIKLMLPAIGVDLLPKIALAAGEGHGNHRQFEVGGTLDGIAGQDAEPATVGGNFVRQANFHGKIGDFRFAGEKSPIFHGAGLRSMKSLKIY